MHTSLLKYYQDEIQRGTVLPDDAQARAIFQLNRLIEEIESSNPKNASWFSLKSPTIQPIIKGLYFWGDVGRGKTWLMDLFFQHLNIKYKKRLHFQHFMKYIHQQLHELKGKQNPLEYVAERMCKEARLWCIDEFFVSSLPDAMILAELMPKLLLNNFILVTTSNRVPESLYLNGLHRQRFLPVIDFINTYCQVMNIDAGKDYRQHHYPHHYFRFPLTDEHQNWIQSKFNELTREQTIYHNKIALNLSMFQPIVYSSKVVWFSFDELCRRPTASREYQDLAKKFKIVLISDVPKLYDLIYDIARRFIYLVDELYDQNVLIMMTSTEPLQHIYQGEMLKFEIERTYSRLIEMQKWTP